MTNRLYSSFLLRFWLVETPDAQGTLPDKTAPLSLQVQHLQTGVIWKFSSLQELSIFLADYLKEPVAATINLSDQSRLEESN